MRVGWNFDPQDLTLLVGAFFPVPPEESFHHICRISPPEKRPRVRFRADEVVVTDSPVDGHSHHRARPTVEGGDGRWWPEQAR